MYDKVQFIHSIKEVSTRLGQAADALETLAEIYTDRGYQSGGANEITADDIANADFNLSLLADAVTLFGQMQTFLSGGSPTPANYKRLINRLRTDM